MDHPAGASSSDDLMEVGIGIASGLQPSYSHATDPDDKSHGFYGGMMNGLGELIGFLGSFPCMICFPNPYRRVKQGKVGLVSRFGKFYKCVDPGLVKVNPVTEHLRTVDVRIQMTEIPSQEIMTKDNVSISIESVMYWHRIDPFKSEYGVSDIHSALMERAGSSLRDVCGGQYLQDLIENRDVISEELRQVIDPAAQNWGVKIEATLIKDITFSAELQEALSSAAQAKRLGESRVITSKAEVDSAKLMRDAAEILNTPAAMQIRYLETLTSMSRNGHGQKTIFMPLPSPGDANGPPSHSGSFRPIVTNQ